MLSFNDFAHFPQFIQEKDRELSLPRYLAAIDRSIHIFWSVRGYGSAGTTLPKDLWGDKPADL